VPIHYKNKQKLRSLVTENGSIILNEFGLNVKILFPLNYLKNVYNKKISYYSFIFYKKYPLLSPNSKNFNVKVMSIKLLDKNLNEIPVYNLTIPIEIYIKRSGKMLSLKKCVFFDDELINWNTTGCKTQEIGEYIVCSCNHLTDFSLGKYDPIKLFNDIFNLVKDSLIIDDFKVFLSLKISNAYMLYVFLAILIVYVIALRSAVKKDLRDENDMFVFQIEEEPKFCTNVEILKKLSNLKEMVDSYEEQMKVEALKFLQFELESCHTQKKEININNGQIIDPKITESGMFNDISLNLNNTSDQINGENIIKSKESFVSNSQIILGAKNIKKGFSQVFLNKTKTKKDSKLKEHINESNEVDNNKIYHIEKIAGNNFFREIELQKIESFDKTISIDNENVKDKEFADFEVQEKTECKNEPNYSKSFNMNALLSDLKNKIPNELIDHKNFINEFYNDENKELKKEIDRFFLIEKKNFNKSVKTSPTEYNKPENLDKRDSVETESTDIEKANSNVFNKNFTPNSNLNGDLNKISSISTNLYTGNNSRSNNEKNSEGNLREDYFENSNDESNSRKNTLIKLIEKTPEFVEKEVNKEENIKIRIKNYKVIRYVQILKHFFVNNYRLFCLIFYTEIPFSKTNFLTLMVSRLIATLGVVTMVSLRITPIVNNSSKVILYFCLI